MLNTAVSSSVLSARDAYIAGMVTGNQGLVGKEAGHWAKKLMYGLGCDYDDLFDELFMSGIIGLRKAAERFDAGRGVKFSTYAMAWVQKYIREAVDDFMEMYQGEAWSLDVPVGGSADDADGGTTRIDMLADESIAAPYARMERDTNVAFARRLLRLLPARERRVVELYHGIGGAGGKTLAEIAELEGVSVQCIHRIYKRALARLRPVAQGVVIAA